jgi:tetratricopeptide (TPR) repeat protein
MRQILLAFAVVLAVLGLTNVSYGAGPPWETDIVLLNQAAAAAHSGGLKAVSAKAGALKKALAGAKSLFPGPVEVGIATYILADGQAEAKAAVKKLGKGATVAENPYPQIAFLLGSFYVETGKFADAVKALDAGLALSPLPKDRLGETVPHLFSERGVALGQLKRWKEALASYDAGLALANVDKHQRAVLYRGRGYALTELGRLDDAVAAYNASLKLDPGNAIAKNELAYIASLQAGGKAVNGTVTLPGAK